MSPGRLSALVHSGSPRTPLLVRSRRLCQPRYDSHRALVLSACPSPPPRPLCRVRSARPAGVLPQCSQAYHRVSRPSRACGRSSRSHSAHHIPPAALLMSQARSPHPRAARALPDGCAVTNRPESYRSSLQLGSRAGPPSVPSPREQCALVGASHTHLLPPSPDPSAGATTQYRVSRTHRRRCTGVRLSLTSALTTFACVRWHSAAFSG
ncbi:hypothetical protein BC628DRAFT_1022996 [Trametes gibbosa]|nr:hypothetical protein BC628DRAFT_1022996 [Trametes gibbosa]